MYVCVYVCVYVCMFVCMYALAVSQEEFVKKGGKDGFRGKCGLFSLYMVSRSFCKQLGPLRAFGLLLSFFFELHLFIVSLRWVGTQTS